MGLPAGKSIVTKTEGKGLRLSRASHLIRECPGWSPERPEGILSGCALKNVANESTEEDANGDAVSPMFMASIRVTLRVNFLRATLLKSVKASDWR